MMSRTSFQYSSKNLSWAFNVEYFDELFKAEKENRGKKQKESKLEDTLKDLNEKLKTIEIKICKPEIPNFSSFGLKVEYPGLMAGTGYPHGTGRFKGEITGGFSLDYVTGSPYLPGSSVKGVLRSAFKHPEYIRELLDDHGEADIKNLESEIFDGADVFLDAYPSGELAKDIIELENITPHHSKALGELNNPDILTFLKVKPGYIFEFRFILKEGTISAESKLELFKQILLDFGAGAKTNVGFGRFTEARCMGCGQPVKINKKTGIPHQYCFNCNQKNQRKKQ